MKTKILTGLLLLLVARANSQLSGGSIYVSSGSYISSTTGASNVGTSWITNRSNTYGAFRFLGTATVSGSDDAHAVNGYVSRIGNSALDFPVGNQAGNDLRTLSVSAPALATDHLSIAYWTGDAGTAIDPTGGAHSRTSMNPSGLAGSTLLVSVSPLGFWDWVPVSGTSPLSVSVSIPDFNVPGGYAIPPAMRLVGWNTVTSQWDNLSGSTGASSNAENTIVTGSVTDMSLYSAIAIGSVSSMPLPVTLFNFEVTKTGGTAIIQWITASEQNCKGFDIEHSPDGKNWTTIGFVNSKANNGNSSVKLAYSFNDNKPVTGRNYYRLKQIDLDGSYKYGQARMVQFDTGNIILVYPNPVNNELFITGLEREDQVAVKNAAGQLMLTVSTTGTSTQTVDISELVKGVYFIEISNKKGKQVVHKIMKQ